MTKLRENTAVVLWVVVFAFGGLWVLQDSGAFENIGMRTTQNIAVVDGVPIAYPDYNEAFDQRLTAYRQETGEEPSQAVRDQLAEQVYQDLVDDVLREREMERLGVLVTDNEVRDLLIGEHPDPLIAQLFPDGEGGVDRSRLVTMFNDPLTFAEIYGVNPVVLEDYLRANRRAEKLDILLTSSIRVSGGEIREEYLRRNQRADVDYVALRYAAIPDEEVEVTDRDLRNFYNENREDFRRPRTVSLDFVSATQVPSPADSQAVLAQLDEIRDRFAEAEDDSLFVEQRFSSIPYSGEYRTPGQIEPTLAAAVYENPAEGRIVGPLLSGEHAVIAKITGVQPTNESAVRARHILFGQRGDGSDARAAAQEQALQVAEQLRAGEIDFDEAARTLSQDPGSAQRGGDLGYFTRGQMVPTFEEAAFGATPGQIVGPVESDFGYHIIEVTGRADQDVQLAIVGQDVSLGSLTIRELRDRVESVKEYHEDGVDFHEEAARQNLEVQSVTVEDGQTMIPGIGQNRQVLDFVERARRGRTSDVLDTGDAFVYLRVTGVQSEGYRPLDEVQAEIEPRVRLEKKREVQVERMQQAIAQHGFDGLADALGVEVRNANNIQFNNTIISGLGREPHFVGTALGLDEGQTSGIVTGDNAVFVLRVTDSTRPDPAAMSEAEQESILNALTQRKVQRVAGEWMQDLRDRATIADNRAQFL